MSKRQVVSVTINEARGVALLRGWGAKELAIDAGHKPMWSHAGKGWCVDAKHVPDVMALAQVERRLVVVHEVGRAAS